MTPELSKEEFSSLACGPVGNDLVLESYFATLDPRIREAAMEAEKLKPALRASIQEMTQAGGASLKAEK